MPDSTKKRGGHQTGFRPIKSTVGRGPVFELRRACGLSQEAMAARLGVAVSTLRSWEYSGKTPRNAAVRANLAALAAEQGGRVE